MRNLYLFAVYFIAAACLFADSYQAQVLPLGDLTAAGAVTISSGKIAGSAVVPTPPPSKPGEWLPLRRNALLWQPAGSPPQNLHPAGDTYYGSHVASAYGNVLGGRVSVLVTYPHHLFPDVMITSQSDQAVTWDSVTGGMTMLHPAGYDASSVNGCYAGQQAGYVGSGVGIVLLKAALWSGSSGSFVNLHPEGYRGSCANGIWGNQQVGGASLLSEGNPPYNSRSHAMLWYGSAASAVDLHPAAFTASEAFGVWNGRQAGMGSLDQYGYTGIQSQTHALLWSGAAESYVDLHPDGFFNSRAVAICGDLQVGYGLLDSTINSCRALLWSGTAESVINLHELLPSIYVRSEAGGIDEYGNVVGTAFLADGTAHAIYWQLIPEPSSCVLLGLGGLLLGRRRHRCSV
jgi:hypothetical protein